MGVEYLLFGQVRAARDGQEVDLGPVQQRCLAAILLTEARHVVSVDAIIDALWPGEPPDRALETVRVYVSRLRKVIELDPRDPKVLVTTGSGYVLNVADGMIDLRRFEAAVTETTANSSNDDRHKDLERSKEALGLWSDAPMADLPSLPFVIAERRRLEGQRVDLIEQWAEWELEVGDSAAVVEPLAREVELHPHRERLWALLVTGLARSGRQTDALRTAAEARQRLNKVGLEPGLELSEAEQAVYETHGEELIFEIPVPVDSFVGRAAELVSVRTILGRSRLTTLTGASGIGKTRLALEAARMLAADTGIEAGFVDLAPVTDGDRVAATIVDSLGLATDVEDHIQLLCDRLTPISALLVIDNAEHLAEDTAVVVMRLIESCPTLTMLVTSRETLHVPGESVHSVSPLLVPDTDEASLEDLYENDGVQLFVARASAADSGFTIDASNVTDVASVVKRLDGVPLAIEFAAARVRTLSPKELSERMDDVFAALGVGQRTILPRHRTLRTAMDWSYRLLDDSEQRLFRNLSVFRGGFAIDTVEALRQRLEGLGESGLDLLGHLVDASMVFPKEEGRFSMLEPVRQYGVALLEELDEIHEASARHAAIYRDLFHLPPDTLAFHSGLDPDMLPKFEAEVDNVRAALRWSVDHDPATAVDLGSSAGDLFQDTGDLPESKRWLDEVWESATEPSIELARVLDRLTFLTHVIDGAERAQLIVEELSSVAEALDSEPWRARVLSRRADLAWFRDDYSTAVTYATEAAARLRRLDHPETWRTLNNIAVAHLDAGNYDEVVAVGDEMISEGERSGAVYAVVQGYAGKALASVLQNAPDVAEPFLSEASEWQGDRPYAALALIAGYIALAREELDRARELAFEAVTEGRKSRQPDFLYRGLLVAALIELRGNNTALARRHLVEGLTGAKRTGFRNFERLYLGPFAVAIARHHPEVATRLAAATDAIHERRGVKMAPLHAQPVEEAVRWLRDESNTDHFETAWQEGIEMTLDEAAGLALDPGQAERGTTSQKRGGER